MKPLRQPESSGTITASVASIVGLALVWSVVWANLPTREELLSDQPQLGAPVPPPVPELDLTIPGVSPASRIGAPDRRMEPAASKPDGRFGDPKDARGALAAEGMCGGELQRICPESLAGEKRRQCAAQPMRQLSASCQRVAQPRVAQGR